MNVVLVDAGPLVALFDRSDPHHAACRTTLESLRTPLATVWPALTEAMYLLAFSWDAQQAVFEMVTTEALRLIALAEKDVPRLRKLMWKYRDLPMDLADAALVRIAEREGVRRIFTLDRRDFAMYRPAKIGRFSIVP